MIEVKVKVDIDHPVDEVFAYISNFENTPKWQSGMVDAQGQGARVSAVITGDASGIFRLAEPLLRQMIQRQINGDYARLKTILEAS